MTTRVRPQVKNQIDAAIASGAQPKAPRSGLGLVLPTAGRFRTIFDKNGITAAGQYYYDRVGIQPPKNFDYQQDPIRKGKSQYITLLDGTMKKISTWDNVNREWKLTALGRLFYAKAVDRYTILWPVRIQLTRINGSIFEREDWLPSTAIDALGEIEVPRTLSETEQRARVARIEQTWRDKQPTIEGEKVLLPGYETHVLDTSRPIQYNKLTVNQQGDVTATIHRPLRQGKPWAFHGLEGISEDSLEETSEECVSYQLSKHIKLKGKDAPWTQQQIAEMLIHVTAEIYEDDEDNNPYDGEVGKSFTHIGFTAAAIMQLCRELCVPIHIKWQNCKIDSFTPERSNYEALCIYIYGDHMFTVDDPTIRRAITREQTSIPKAPKTEVLATIGKKANSTPASQYWQTYSKLKPGHFKTNDLMAVRAEMLRDGICPQVRLSGTGMPKGLRYNDCIIHNWPQEAHVCLKFLEELSKTRAHTLQYRGESLATFGQMVFDEFCKPCDRPFLTAEIRKEIAGKQKGRCNVCGDLLGKAELDHVIPRGGQCYGSDDPKALAYLCRTCHSAKTSEDRARMNVEDSNVYMSRFSKEVWDAFVESRRPTQNVCNLNEASDGQCLEIDVRSCRLNGIIEGNCEEIPIFSPLDQIVKAKEGDLYDYQWVDIGSIRCPLKKYIFDGPRWYSKAEVKYMLETGVCQWRHIKLGLEATAHRTASDLATVLKKIRSIWLEVGKSIHAEWFLGNKAEKKSRSDLLSKTALLSLLGAWGRKDNYRYSMVTTSHPDDIPWTGEVSTKPTPCSEMTDTGYVFHDITWKQKVRNLATFLPLNLIGRIQERLQVARLLQALLLSTDPKRILSIQVDAVYVQVPAAEAKKIEQKFKTLKYCHLNEIASPLARSLTTVKSPNNTSTELVYKCTPCDPRFPGGELTVAPCIDLHELEPLQWTYQVERKDGPDDFVDKVLDHVKQKKAFTCLGAPGTGKTKGILAKVRELLLEQGENVVCLAPTHAAARLLPGGGDTIHHFVGKYAMQGAFKGWILLDEISMCCLPLLAALDQLRLADCKICTFGDWDQLPPHPDSNSWRGCHVSPWAFKESRLYKSWSDCTCFQLTRCRRSDQEHFDFYTGLPQTLPKAISQSRKRYRDADDADLHICISHKRRRAINSYKQTTASQGKQCIEIPAGDDPSFQCFVGTRLVGNATTGKFVNGGRYTVTALGDGCISLRDEITENIFQASVEAISKHCMLAWAMVYPKVQGCTTEGTVMLHDMKSPYLRRCHLYVGLSRVTDGSNAFIAYD
jgi:hypothetical protein